MKYVFAALLALLLTTPAQAAVNPTNAFMGLWKDAQGSEMKILPEYQDDGAEGDYVIYPIDLFRTSVGGQRTTWTMTARYNANTDRLEYGDGTKIMDGRIALTDSKGYLKLDGNGSLLWMDSGEADSTKLRFLRTLSPAPGVDDFADGYLRPVADLGRGTSDAARRAARTIVQVLRFAETRALWNADGEEMQRNLEAAWERLTPEERARFDAVFDDGVSEPADEAFENYAAVKRVFDSADVGDEMARLATNIEVRLSWEFLSSATLNMGNLDEAGAYEDAVG